MTEEKTKKRIVIKIGTAILTGKATLAGIVQEAAALHARGWEVILVTSGAIGSGVRHMGWLRRPQEVRKKQAAAAVGQVALMQTYQKLFEAHKIRVAQILLTRSDFEERQRYLNARATLLTLLEYRIVPVINENDTVATEEIQFGDNDRLSALVAAKIDADLLLILSDVDGLLGSRENGAIVPLVPKITPEIERLVWRGVKGEEGTGGMASKIEAAKIATASGVTAVVANGFKAGVVSGIAQGKSIGTKFLSEKSLSAKERWILFGALPKGEITVDSGAAQALAGSGKSLLAAGVTAASGDFRRGDVVSIKTEEGRELARGIVSFSVAEVDRIKRKRSAEIARLLSRPAGSFEVVHRDSLILLP